MNRFATISLLLLALLVMSGCGRGPANREQAKALAKWVGDQSYSTYSMFRHLDRTPQEPPSPDGLTLGSPNVFAAIGTNPKDLMSVDVLWTDRRTARPFAKPMTVSLVKDGRDRGIADFTDQTLRRVRHTAISVSQAEEAGARVTAVDFAPMGKDDNFLARWFLVENDGKAAARFSLRLRVGASGEWKRRNAKTWVRENLAFVSDTKLTTSQESLEAGVGSIGPGEKGAAAVLIVGVKNAKDLDKQIAHAQKAVGKLMASLNETKSNWTEWVGRAPMQTGDERTDDLLDSMLCLMRSHVGAEAIHTGSLRYPHNRAWIRDDYWVQRTLLKLGYAEEARVGLDFFHRAWKSSGIASYYEIPSGKSTAYGYGGVELPHYLVLMVRDAEMEGAVDGVDYWDMVKDCLDRAEAPESGLQPMNGDETWLLASPVRELDDLLDNSWLLIASAEYGSKLAERAGDTQRAARYGAMAYRARMALTKFEPGTGDPQWYAIGRGGDGSLDFSLCPEVFARGVILGVLPETDRYLQEGLAASWDRLQFDRGIRAHSRSATIDGGAPGYVLSAAAAMQLPFTRDLATRVLKFASATGNVWEFHDMYDPAWAGEKRRLWDSGVLLMGMVEALFEVQHAGTRVMLEPRPAEAAGVAPGEPGLFGASEAEDLLAKTGGALILQQQSPEHAARMARELLRQRNRAYAIGDFTGEPPAENSAIIIAPTPPPAEWAAGPGYWVRKWDGPTQFWVMNSGDAFLDTDPLLFDLLSYLAPRREKPLPFPDANLDLSARWAVLPAGEAEVTASAGPEQKQDRVNLAGGRLPVKMAGAQVEVRAEPGEGNTLKLTVSAAGGRTVQSEVNVTLPAGWWLVVARDMTGKWDRVKDPVSEARLPDGRLRLTYSFQPGTDSLNLTFQLAKLRVVGG